MSFDLNIQNYNIRELEEIFELPTGYDASIVEMKETKLRQNILTDPTVSANVRTGTLQFLENVKKKLVNNLQQKTGPNNMVKIPGTNGSGNKSDDSGSKKNGAG